MNQYMIARRLVTSILLVMAMAVSAVAQLTTEDKRDVLRAMDRVLTDEAFVPGVDLTRWPSFLAKRKAALDETESPFGFANVVNGALREFGISHIRLNMSGRRRSYGGGDELLLQFRRGSGARDSVRWLNDDIAMIRISSFAQSYDPEIIEEMFDRVSDAKGLVLDLRSNGGGLVEHMHHLLAQMLPSETPVGTFVTRRTAEAFIKAGKGDGSNPIEIAKWSGSKFKVRSRYVKPFAGKVVILQDEASASASEIVASAMRESRGSLIVGTRSAGAVLMSTFSSLPHGFQIQYPISDYVSIKGMRLEGNPLMPDVSLPADQARSTAAIEAALERLKI